MKPLISICIPAYNVENYIGQCLDSVINQGFDDYEILLVDNGSDDRTPEICECYALRHPEKIKFEKLAKPTKFGRAAFRAVLMSSGVYVFSMDSDDYLQPGALMEIGRIAKTVAPDIIMIDYKCIAEEGLVARNNVLFDVKQINDVPYYEAIKYIASSPSFLTCMWMYITKINPEFKEKVRQLNEQGDINGDAAAVLSQFMGYESIYYIDQKFYTYRLRYGSISTQEKSSVAVRGSFMAVLDLLGMMACPFEKFNLAQRIEILYPMCLRYFKISLADFGLLHADDLEVITTTIERRVHQFSFIKDFNYYLFRKFYEFIIKFGANDGLRHLVNYERELLIDVMAPQKNNRIYVMPTGGYGESAATDLLEVGFNIVGFLDNSDAKNQLHINNLICNLPRILELEPNIENVSVVIASVYENHVSSMKDQLLSFGIAETNIVIRSRLDEY